ncbi:hypothetical protein [Pseudogracilibacillus sp. SO30301A]
MTRNPSAIKFHNVNYSIDNINIIEVLTTDHIRVVTVKNREL